MCAHTHTPSSFGVLNLQQGWTLLERRAWLPWAHQAEMNKKTKIASVISFFPSIQNGIWEKRTFFGLPLKTGSVFASIISSSGSFLYRIPELSSKMSNVKKFHKLPRLCFWKYYPSCLVSFVQDATSCLRYSDLTTVYFLIFSTFFFVIMNKNSFISPNHYLWLWNLNVENKLKYNEQN